MSRGLLFSSGLLIATHSEADFTHGICPECVMKHYPELYNQPKDDSGESK